MVLDTSPGRSARTSISRFPRPNAAGFTSKIVPVVPADCKPAPRQLRDGASSQGHPSRRRLPPTEPAAAAAETEAAASTETKRRPRKPAAPAEPRSSAAVKATAKTVAGQAERRAEPRPPKARRTGSFVVQVAALSDADKAKQMRSRLPPPASRPILKWSRPQGRRDPRARRAVCHARGRGEGARAAQGDRARRQGGAQIAP